MVWENENDIDHACECQNLKEPWKEMFWKQKNYLALASCGCLTAWQD